MQRKHDNLEDGLLAGFDEAQAACKNELEALRKQVLKPESNVHQVRSMGAKNAEKLFAEGDAASSRFHKVFAALRLIMRGHEEKKNNALDMLSKL